MRYLLVLALVLTVAGLAEAGPFRRRHTAQPTYHSVQQSAASSTVTGPGYSSHSTSWQQNSVTVYGTQVGDALDELNAKRMARGLRPFARDEGLTQGALACASFRAQHRIAGHVMGGRGDFGFLPPGTHAASAGCSAVDPSWGFLSCCMYEHWTYAGAAKVRGSDGKMYYELFVK